jgi:hypothetical protein
MTPLFQPNQPQPRNPHLYHPDQGAKVQPTGQHTKTPHTATGLFALLDGLLGAKGTGAPPRLTNRTGDGKIRLGNLLIVKQLDYCLGKPICHRVTLALSAALLTLSFGVTTAEAAVTHKYEPVPSKEITAGVPAGTKVGPEPALTGPLTSVNAMAVDSGFLYIAEWKEGTNGIDRLDKFDASTGTFISQFPQVPSLHGNEMSVAVAHSSRDVYAAGEKSEVVAVFSEAGALEGLWTGLGSVGGLAVDNNNPLSLEDWAKGDVYVLNGNQAAVDVFKPGIKGAKGTEEAPEAAGPPLTGTCPSTGKTVGGTECAAGVEEVPFTQPRAVAVSQSTGEVLVLDHRTSEAGEGVDVVDVFKPTGLNQFVFVRQLTGTPNGGPWEAPSNEFTLHGVAAGVNGDIYVSEQNHVDQFNSEGVYEGHLSETPAGPFPGNVAGVAVDQASGGVYIGTRELAGVSADRDRWSALWDMQSRGGVAPRPSALSRFPSSCGCRPRVAASLRVFRDGAGGRGASRGGDDVERFAGDGLAQRLVVGGSQLQHARKRVEHHLPRLRDRMPLAEDAGHLGDRHDDPVAVGVLLVDDRQFERAGHGLSVAKAAQGGEGQARTQTIFTNPSCVADSKQPLPSNVSLVSDLGCRATGRSVIRRFIMAASDARQRPHQSTGMGSCRLAGGDTPAPGLIERDGVLLGSHRDIDDVSADAHQVLDELNGLDANAPRLSAKSPKQSHGFTAAEAAALSNPHATPAEQDGSPTTPPAATQPAAVRTQSRQSPVNATGGTDK